MKKGLLSIIAGSILALAPSLNAQNSDDETKKNTLVVYESPTKVGTHQSFLLREVKNRYEKSAEYVELSPNFPKEIISKEIQDELIKKNGIPEQVLVLADYKSFTKEGIVTANKWIRNLDDDPFPDARLSFFPTHPKYTEELKKLVHREPYFTKSALTRFDDQVISFLKKGINVNHREPIIEIKENGKITQKKVKNQWEEYAKAVNSGEIDYIAKLGHSSPGVWESTDLTSNIENLFCTVGMDNQTLIIKHGDSVVKTKKHGEKFTSELKLEEIIKKHSKNPFPVIGSQNPKIVDNYACCNSILPPHVFKGHEFSTVISEMVGNNAYVWGYERDVTVVPQAGSHQLLFLGAGGINSFTESLLGSTIFVTAQRERLEREGNLGSEYESLKEDEFSGAFFGLPNNLTYADVTTRIYNQNLSQQRKPSSEISTKLEIELKESTAQNDYRMRMWSAPVTLLDKRIDPLSIRNATISVDGREYELLVTPRKAYSTAIIPDKSLEGEITFADNAIVLGIAPITDAKTRKPKYREITRDQSISIKFDSR